MNPSVRRLMLREFVGPPADRPGHPLEGRVEFRHQSNYISDLTPSAKARVGMHDFQLSQGTLRQKESGSRCLVRYQRLFDAGKRGLLSAQ